MTSHWPTFADGLFWCACDNRTFDTEEEWLVHVFYSVLGDRALGRMTGDVLVIDLKPSNFTAQHADRGR